jgi:signal transduction histidine kinase
MRVAPHASIRRPKLIKKNRKSAASKQIPEQKKNGVQRAVKDPVPEWAQTQVFAQAKIVAWEGILSPLKTTALFPKKGSFIDSILLIRRGNINQWAESIHPLDARRVRNIFADIKSLPVVVDYRLVDTQGAIAWVRHSIIETKKKGRQILAKGFVCDIQTEKELELESLRVSEREQNRIGQDLHDDLCQVLAGVSCLMRVAEGRLASKVPEEIPYLTELNQQIIEAMHRTRALTHGLYPGKIQVADVRGALLELVAQVRTRFQVEVRTEFTGRFPRHSSNQIIQIYRLTQEAISNAIKHGHAKCIDVRLEAKPSTMLLSITDNGTGLSQAEPSEKGVGLNIMQYRTRTLGGEFSIANAPDQGVRVTLQYPFEH